MPAEWTAELIGGMHLQRVTAKQLAAEVGWHPKYLSAVLNGRRNPNDAEKKLKAALLRIEIKRDRLSHGLSDDLEAVAAEYREMDPAYATVFERDILLREVS